MLGVSAAWRAQCPVAQGAVVWRTVSKGRRWSDENRWCLAVGWIDLEPAAAERGIGGHRAKVPRRGRASPRCRPAHAAGGASLRVLWCLGPAGNACLGRSAGSGSRRFEDGGGRRNIRCRRPRLRASGTPRPPTPTRAAGVRWETLRYAGTNGPRLPRPSWHSELAACPVPHARHLRLRRLSAPYRLPGPLHTLAIHIYTSHVRRSSGPRLRPTLASWAQGVTPTDTSFPVQPIHSPSDNVTLLGHSRGRTRALPSPSHLAAAVNSNVSLLASAEEDWLSKYMMRLCTLRLYHFLSGESHLS